MRTGLPQRNTSNQIFQAATIIRVLLCVFTILCTDQIMSAQQTAEEWLKQAEEAVAEGRTEDAASAYSGAAHEQMKNGEYEKAGDNYKKAAEKYRDAGREAQANAEAKNAGFAYEKAAEKAAEDGDHKRAAELSDKAAEQYDAAGLTGDAARMRGNADYERQLAMSNYTGNSNVSVKPTGTGRTIGNIANISVTNKNSYPVTTVAQNVYIPAREGTQDYVGRVPGGIVVPPNSTIDIPIDGICTNPFTPPVGAGDPTTDLDEWVPVGGSYPPISSTSSPPGGIIPDLIDVPQVPDEMNPPTSIVPPGTVPVILVTSTPVLDFTPEAIPDITTSKGFNPVPTPGDIVVTWPGTDIPVGGSFNPKADPRTYARVIVDAVDRIETAAREIQESGQYLTPFTPDPPREYEALCQHSVWIFAATVTGGTYDEDAFEKNVHAQMFTSTGIAVTDLPDEQQEEMEAGVSDFWNAYMATGVTAKVIPEAMMPGGNGAGTPELIGVRKNVCKCEEPISVPVTIQIQKRDGNTNINDGDPIEDSLVLEEETIRVPRMTDANNQVVLTLGAIEQGCICITAEHAKAMEEEAELKKPTSKISKAIQEAKEAWEAQKAKLGELEDWEKEASEKRSITAESKMNIIWKAYMPKDRMNEFDKDNKKGKRAAQLEELKKVIREKIEAAENAHEAAGQPLKDKAEAISQFFKNAKDCDVFNDSKKRVRGPEVTIKSGQTTIAPKAGVYTFKTSSLSFYIRVKYYCVGDNCDDTVCEKEIKVKFDD